jgi:hypothetical protein
MGGGDADSSKLVQRQETEPEFVAPLQDQHYRVAFFDPHGPEKRRRLVTVILKLAEGKAGFIAFVIAPDQGKFIRTVQSQFIGHVIGKIEAFRNIYGKVLREIFIRIIPGPGNKPLQHNMHLA